MDSDSDIFDHSTTSGKIRAYVNRFMKWKGLFIAVNVFVLAFIVWSLAGAGKPENTLALGANIPGEEKFDPVTGEYVFDGFPGGIVFKGISVDVGDKLRVREFKILNAIVDAGALSASVEGMTNLERISIEVRRVIGNYSRVLLPNLKSFNYSLRQDVNVDLYKPADVIHSILFYDKVEGQNWTVEGDILNLGVDVSLYVRNTVIIEFNRSTGLLNMDVPFCEAMLGGNMGGSFTKLIISWCKFPKTMLIPPGLKYLSLSNAFPQSVAEMEAGIAKTRSLEEFHGYQPFLNFDEDSPSYYVLPEDPEYQLPLDLAVFPASLKLLSALRLGITASTIKPSGITELSLQESNVTEIVIENFGMIFSKLNTLRVFNASGMPNAMENNTFSRLVEEAMRNVNSIVISGFTWDLVQGSPNVTRVFETAGLLPVDTNFVLTKNASLATWSAETLTDSDVYFLRYEHLAFNDIYRHTVLTAGSNLVGFNCLYLIALLILSMWIV